MPRLRFLRQAGAVALIVYMEQLFLYITFQVINDRKSTPLAILSGFYNEAEACR